MFRAVHLDQVPGLLYLHSMPGRCESIESFLREYGTRKMTRTICLNDEQEIARKSPSYAGSLEAGAYRGERDVFPIQNLGVPDDRDAFARLALDTATRIRAGERILIHCAMGIGRTGTLATCVAIALGMSEKEARARVLAAGGHPETPAQDELIHWFAEEHAMTTRPLSLPRPAAGDHSPGMAGYVAAVPDLTDAVKLLTMQRDGVRQRLSGVNATQAAYRYAEGKWSVREVVGHLADAERIFGYRLLRIGRGDDTPLPGFEENDYVPAGAFEQRDFGDVLEEWVAVRNATLALVRGLPAEAWKRSGTANGKKVTTVALVYVTYGHVEHHLKLLQERYKIP